MVPNTPTPKLGTVSAITIASKDLDDSLAFYQQLGFREVLRSDFPFPLIQITDGALLIMLRKDSLPYIALTYYVKDVDAMATALEADGIVFHSKPQPKDFIKRYVTKSPDGMNVSLVTFVDGFSQPTGRTLLTTPPQDYARPETYPNTRCGLFGEFANAVRDIDISIGFWEKLGFAVLSKMNSGYPWAILSDGLSIVGLHQTTSFEGAIITYFAFDSAEKIEALKAAGLKGYDEKGAANIVLNTPEGQKINLFKLGM